MSISKHTISSSITKHVDIQCETIRVFVLCVRETDTTCTDVYRNKQTAISCFCGANHRVCETFSFDRKFLSFVHSSAFNFSFNRNRSWVSTFSLSLFLSFTLYLLLLLSFTRSIKLKSFCILSLALALTCSSFADSSSSYDRRWSCYFFVCFVIVWIYVDVIFIPKTI